MFFTTDYIKLDGTLLQEGVEGCPILLDLFNILTQFPSPRSERWLAIGQKKPGEPMLKLCFFVETKAESCLGEKLST